MTKTFQISAPAFYSTHPHHQRNRQIMTNRHSHLINKSGGTRKKKRYKKRRYKKKGGSKTCGCSGVPTASATFTAGASQTMSPNGNGLIKIGQQNLANTLCSGSLDSMGDSWSTSSGGGKRKRLGGSSALGSFVESLNNMNGGKKRKKTRRRRRRKSTRKKRRKSKKRRRNRKRSSRRRKRR